MTKEEQTVFYHRLAEAFKHAYSKRTFFGDEDFVDLKSVCNKIFYQDFFLIFFLSY